MPNPKRRIKESRFPRAVVISLAGMVIIVVGLVAALLVPGWPLRKDPAGRGGGPDAAGPPGAAATTPGEGSPRAGPDSPEGQPHLPSHLGGIAGRALRADGGPAAGIEVIFVPHAHRSLAEFTERGRYREWEPFATTDDRGAFLQHELSPGEYTVAFRASGYAYAEYRPAVTVRAGEVTRGIEQTLEKAGVIFGQVVDAISGAPIAGATVSAALVSAKEHAPESHPHHKKISTLTDDKGAFRLDVLLRPAAYDITADHDEYAREVKRSVRVDTGVPLRLALSPGGMVEGRVIDGDGGPAVPEATVRATSGGKPITEVKTDSEGRFRIRGLEAGRVRLEAEKDGRYTEDLPDHEIDVQPPGLTMRDLVLVPGGAVELTVIDKDTGEPIPGAEVRFSNPQETRITDGEGKARLEGLNKGEVGFQARAEGFVATSDPGARPPTIGIKLGRTISRTCVLQRERFFSGVVVDENDRPVPGARVHVGFRWEGRMGTGVRVDDATTDGDGRFRVGGVEAGYYSLTATKDGFARSEFHAYTDAAEELRVVLHRGAVLEGTVMDARGTPLEGFKVQLRHHSAGAALKSAVSDGEGRWTMTGVEQGNYEITAQKDERRTNRIEIGVGWTDHILVDLVLEEGVTIAGSVVDALEGHGLPDLSLTLMTVDRHGRVRDHSKDTFRRQTKGDSSGRFTFTEVPSGRYEIQLAGIPATHLNPTQYDRVLVTAENEDILDLEIKLRRGACVRGRVLLPSGEGAAEARLALDSADHSLCRGGRRLKADENGNFELTGIVHAQKYCVAAWLPGYGRAFSEPFNLRQGEVIDGIILRLKIPGSISGTVRDDEGNPVTETYRVQCGFPQASGDISEAGSTGAPMIDDTGQYRFDDLPPGTVIVMLHAQVPCFDGTDGCWSVVQRKRVEVRSGEETAGVDFFVPSKDKRREQVQKPLTGHIAGRLVDGQGKGIGGATVRVQCVSWSQQSGVTATAKSDRDGTFSIAGIVEGTFRLTAEEPDHVPATVDGLVSPSDGVEVVLARYASIEGRAVRKGTGDPVPEFVLHHGKPDTKLTDAPVSDPQGRFRLDRLSPGPYLLRVDVEGVGVAQRRVEIEDGASIPDLVLELRSPYELTGQVIRKKDRTPIAGAVVIPSMGETTTTGLDGFFAITGIYPGPVAITVEHPDHGKAHFPGIEVPEEGVAEDVLLELDEPGRIVGHVYDSTGRPWEGIVIRCASQEARSDYHGRYEFPVVAPGEHTLELHLWSSSLPGGGNWTRRIALGPGETITVDFGGAGGTITGLVTENGNPKHLAVVTFKNTTTERYLQTDRGGEYRIYGLEPGPYDVTIRNPSDKVNLLESRIEVPPGGDLRLDFVCP